MAVCNIYTPSRRCFIACRIIQARGILDLDTIEPFDLQSERCIGGQISWEGEWKRKVRASRGHIEQRFYGGYIM